MTRSEVTALPRRRTLTARQADLLNRLEQLFLAEGFGDFTLDDLAAQIGRAHV